MEAKNMSTNDTLSMKEVTDRVQLLTDFLHCNGKMYLSKYNSSGTLIDTNSDHMIYDTIFRSTKFLDEAINFANTSNQPLILTSEVGMMWSVVYQRDVANDLSYLHIMGPVFTTSLSDETIEVLNKNPKIREKWKPTLISYLRAVPVVGPTDFIKYTLMLHYAVNNEYLKPSKITFSNINYVESFAPNSTSVNYAEQWAMENSLTQMIRSGDIYYKNKIASAASILQRIHPSSMRELDETKQYATIFTGQCIRAAIDGGISPDTAYTRGNVYLKNIISAKSPADVISITHSVFEDYLFQVHNHQDQPSYSQAIHSCIDFIESHTEDTLNIDYLASQLGYSKYYLSKKFKLEVGVSVNTYIKKARINRACFLLVSTKMDIQEISDLLQFGNRNFFTKVFKEETGTNPAAFRHSHQKPL